VLCSVGRFAVVRWNGEGAKRYRMTIVSQCDAGLGRNAPRERESHGYVVARSASDEAIRSAALAMTERIVENCARNSARDRPGLMLQLRTGAGTNDPRLYCKDRLSAASTGAFRGTGLGFRRGAGDLDRFPR